MADAPIDPMTQPAAWNSIAIGYEDAFFARAARLVSEAIAEMQLAPTATILDVATGPGTFALRAAPLVAKVVAVDFSVNMIDRLRRHASELGLGNIDTHVMDGHALDLPDQSFDGAISMFGWFLFSDRPRGLAEMVRVVRPGARVVVTSWSTPDRNNLLGAGLEAMRAALPDMPRPPKAQTQDPEVCAGEARDAGLRDVRTRIVVDTLGFDSVDEYWQLMERGGAPMAVLRERIGEDAFRGVGERAKAHLRSQLGEGGFELGVAAIMTSGVKG